jgi:hypothetical protein
MENVYGLVKHRNFYVVFANDDILSEELFKSPQLDFVFHDEVYETGSSHFVFLRENIEQLPAVDVMNLLNQKI